MNSWRDRCFMLYYEEELGRMNAVVNMTNYNDWPLTEDKLIRDCRWAWDMLQYYNGPGVRYRSEALDYFNLEFNFNLSIEDLLGDSYFIKEQDSEFLIYKIEPSNDGKHSLFSEVY